MVCGCDDGCDGCQQSSPNRKRSRSTIDCKHSPDVLSLSDAASRISDLPASHKCTEFVNSENPPDDVQEEETGESNSSLDFNLVAEMALVELFASTKFSIANVESIRRLFTPSVKTSRRKITEGIVDLYKQEKDIVKEELAMVPGRISLRIGIWADSWEMNCNYKFICIISRWIDNDWEVKERILEFKSFLHPYYPEDMDQWISNWKIDRKLLGMSFDEEAHQSLDLTTSLKSCLISDGSKDLFSNIQCCEHLLNSIVTTILKCIEPIKDKIRHEISHIVVSSHRKEFYKWAQMSYRVDVTKKLIRDFPGRWNSTYMMLDRALLYKEALLEWGRNDEVLKEFELTDDEWEKIAIFMKFLKVLYDVISSFSRSKYPTSNIYLIGINQIYCHLVCENQGFGHDFLRGMINDAREKLHKYWLDNSLVLSCAAIFDPRYKTEFAESCYTRIFSDESMAKEYVNRDLAVLHSLFDEYNEKFSYLSIHENKFSPSKSELDRYLEEERVDGDIDILEYWGSNDDTDRYPVLAMMARDILAIPVSVLGSEGCFYVGDKVTMLVGTPRVHENLHVRICVADWRRAHTSSDSGQGGLAEEEKLLALDPFQEDEDEYKVEVEDEDDEDDDDDAIIPDDSD